MVSASGAPGTAALLRALRENGEREVRLVGTDMSPQAVGRHLCGGHTGCAWDGGNLRLDPIEERVGLHLLVAVKRWRHGESDHDSERIRLPGHCRRDEHNTALNGRFRERSGGHPYHRLCR